MKLSRFSVLIATFLFCFSCVNKDSPTMVSKSPDGKIKITVSGHKEVMFDPWEVTLTASTDKWNRGVTLQVHNGELNKDNVTFQWNGNTCMVLIDEQDNTKKRIRVRATENSLSIKEI